MAKTVAWERRAQDLRTRVKDSDIEEWTRRDIMRLFDVQSTAAKHILRAVGKVHKIGNVYFVQRQDLLTLLEKTTKSQSVTAEFRRNLLEFRPPQYRPIPFTIDERLRVTRVEDLPPHIVLEPGHLDIRTPPGSEEMLESIKQLISALENDPEGVNSCWEAPEISQPEDLEEKEKAAMRAGIERFRLQREARKAGRIASPLPGNKGLDSLQV